MPLRFAAEAEEFVLRFPSDNDDGLSGALGRARSTHKASMLQDLAWPASARSGRFSAPRKIKTIAFA
jgi:hypothetical protein